jgi:hypothetical protein
MSAPHRKAPAIQPELACVLLALVTGMVATLGVVFSVCYRKAATHLPIDKRDF